MKKALVILLTLAVAGGLFAQTFAWSGAIHGGIGLVGKGADDDVVFGVVNPTNGANGVRSDLHFNFTNADANAGARVTMRANNLAGGPGIDGLTVRNAFAWVRFADNLVEFRGGRITDEPHMGNPDYQGRHVGPGHGVSGLVSYISPMDNFRIGLGLWSGVGIGNGAAWDAAGLTGWGGFVFNVPGAARINAQLRFAEAAIDAAAGLSLTAIDVLPIRVGVQFNRLDEFGDVGVILANADIGLNFIANLSLGVAGGIAMNQARDDMGMGFGAWVAFPVGNLTPRLDVWYVSGGQYNYNQFGVSQWKYTDNWTYNADQVYLSLRPSLAIRAAANAFFDLGAVVNVEMGDVGAGGGNADNAMSFGLFTSVRVNF